MSARKVLAHPDQFWTGCMTPESTRVRDYLLGGKDNYISDREAAARLSNLFPAMQQHVRAAKWFHHWACTYLAKHGAAQFLDIGAGFPSPTDTHHAVRGINPDAVVLYVDADRFVAAHRRALSCDEHARAVEADLADTGALINRVRESDFLDFHEPIVLSIGGWVLEQLPEAAAAVRELSAAIVPGSWLVISHLVTDPDEQLAEHIGAECRLWMPEFRPRSVGEIETIVADYTLLDPGIIAPQGWAENVSDYPETLCRNAIGRLGVSP